MKIEKISVAISSLSLIKRNTLQEISKVKKFEYPPHWLFALATSLTRLEELVWQYDVDAETEHLGYSKAPSPQELINIINGFLGQREQLYGGHVERLEKMLTYLQRQLVPIYRDGRSNAQEYWEKTPQAERYRFTNFESPEIRSVGRGKVPKDLNQTEEGWFIEGFARQWAEEVLAYYLQDTSDTT